MKVIFGSCIEAIIDPQMDLGEAVGLSMLWCAKPAALTSQQRLACQQWEIKCVFCGSPLLSSPHNDSQVGSGIRQSRKDLTPLWSVRDKFIISSSDAVPSGAACAAGSLFRADTPGRHLACSWVSMCLAR